MDWKAWIVGTIQSMSGAINPTKIFDDWVKASAMAMSNACSLHKDKVYEERERAYKEIVGQYKEDQVETFCKMTGALAMSLEECIEDVLGEIFMKIAWANKNVGQFFTSFHLSVLTAKAAMAERLDNWDGSSKIELLEPSSGAGGMIIAAAKVLAEREVDYQRYMKVVAQDLDWRSVYMCYLQLSLLGIDAVCVQGDSLAGSYSPTTTDQAHVFRSPRNRGAII